MKHLTKTIPFADFYISTSKETPARFTCSGVSGGYEIHIEAGYAGAYGLGERYDALNYLGRSAEIAVEEKFCRQGSKSYCPMPFFWTDAGFGVWLDTARVTRFSFAPGEIVINIPANCGSPHIRRDAAGDGRGVYAPHRRARAAAGLGL